MKMHKEEYEKLLKRFALEVDEIGVTEDMLKLISDRCISAPNIMQVAAEETTDRFVYRHKGYVIEAKRTVELTIKTCK